MLITDHFVMLNYPKSGSTFARTVVREIYAKRLSQRSLFERLLCRAGLKTGSFVEELRLPNIMFTGVQRPPTTQHGAYCQIPAEFRDREVVTVVRNPYSRFLSNYEFRFWEKYPPIPEALIHTHFPQFPSLSINDFTRLQDLALVHGRLNGRTPGAQIGNQTAQFIQMFFKDPKQILADITDEYIDSDRILDDAGAITFLRQESLNDELAGFLLAKGFQPEEIEFIHRRSRVNVTEQGVADRNSLWTKEALEYVRTKERMVIRFLDSYGIHYQPPVISNDGSDEQDE